MSVFRAFFHLFLAALLAPGFSLLAADKALAPGHVPKAVASLKPVGKLAPGTPLNLAIGLPLRDEKGVDDFLAQVCNPASVNYRQFLTPAEFTERFGPTEADYRAVLAFAGRNGLVVKTTHPNRLLVDVQGSVADIQRAFHITLWRYRHPTEARDFYAPDTEPTVEARLPISDVSGLDNYRLPSPRIVRMTAATNAASAVPQFGSGPGSAYQGRDFRAAYLPAVTLTGSGQMLGLVQFDGFYAKDIATYESGAGLPAVPIQLVLLDDYDGTPTGTANGNLEVSLDIEMAVSMAPGLSRIIVFEAGPNGLPNDILNAMAASNEVKQLSCSWGWPGGPSATTDDIFKQMAAQGQSFFNASGDSDAFTPGQVDDPSQQEAPTSSPYITAVGGTTLTTTGPGGSWLAERVWNWGGGKGSSGGISSYYPIPDWQTNTSMATNGGSPSNRNLPDVALIADNVHVRYGNGVGLAVGGTSCAAPLWAGLAALMNQRLMSVGNAPLGFINPAVYSIGNSSSYTSNFHDITLGDNISSSSPTNFHAVPGYDLCTGWGTPAGSSLIDALAGLPDPLGIAPVTGFAATGAPGGPFNLNAGTFFLTNSGSASLTWSLNNTSAWLTVASTGGDLAAAAFTNVTVTLAPPARNLEAGVYTANLSFSNWNSKAVQTLAFTLQVGQSLVRNGDFEMGVFSPWTLVGNTVSGQTIYNAVGNLWNFPLTVRSGVFGAFLGDSQIATLSQTLATVPGQNYLLSLWLDNSTNGPDQQFQINWITNSGLPTTIFNWTNPPVFAWTNLQFIVTAAATNSILQFAAQNPPNFFGLDDVTLVPLVTPAFRALSTPNPLPQLSWSTTPGLTYQVQYKTDLAQANWSNLGLAFTATNSLTTITDSDATDMQRFYRLVLSP